MARSILKRAAVDIESFTQLRMVRLLACSTPAVRIGHLIACGCHSVSLRNAVGTGWRIDQLKSNNAPSSRMHLALRYTTRMSGSLSTSSFGNLEAVAASNLEAG